MNYAWVGSITNLPITQEDETAERSVTFGSGQRPLPPYRCGDCPKPNFPASDGRRAFTCGNVG
jgi:hypothetical protein